MGSISIAQARELLAELARDFAPILAKARVREIPPLAVSRSKQRLGETVWARTGVHSWRADRIKVSAYLLAQGDRAAVRSVLIHELAHLAAGPKHGHDDRWRSLHRAMGGDGKRLATIELAAPHKYTATCPRCGHQVHFDRRWSRPHSCARCVPGRFDPSVVLTVVQNY